MSDSKRLRDKLAKLGKARTPTSNGREIKAVNTTDFRRAVLHEIDETILGRALNFRNESDKGFTLEVANRRLHSVSASANDGLVGTTELSGQQFAEQSDVLVEHFDKLLESFFTGAHQIFVKTFKLSDSHDPENIGCAASVIAEAWSLVLYDDGQPTSINVTGAFLESCSGLAISWVQFDTSGIGNSAGEPEQVKNLTALATHDISAFDSQMEKTFDVGARCAVVGAIDIENLLVVYVNDGAQGAFLTVPSDSIVKIQELWGAAQS